MSRTFDQTRTWDRHSIRAEISRRGYTLADLSRRAGLSDNVCRLSLVRPSPSGDAVIAKLLGVKLSELWPDRYDAEGRRLIAVRRRIRKRPRSSKR